MKAKVEYNSGLMLKLPKQTNSSELFLEWISQFRAGLNLVHKTINTDDEIIIRMNCDKTVYLECAEYINNNL